jgi:hypothetical protein
MSRRYSPIADLYGLPPEDTPPKKGGRGWLIIVLVLAGVFAYESSHLVMRLRPDPPSDFMGVNVNSDEASYHAQERLARDCWDYAIQHLQNAYPYGQSLPLSPTFGFANAPAIRIKCWPALRSVWTQKESWEWSYEWSTDWLSDPRGFFQEVFRRLWP